jgi:3-methyl-2-oxobutanoate hydroxymethyltransferase
MLNISKILASKSQKKLTMITAYDFPSAVIAQDAGIDMILVGDSISNTVFGNKDTLPVELEDMIFHSKIVKKGAEETFVIGDLPFLSYQCSEEKAIESCGKFLKYGRVDAVKLEGGKNISNTVKKIVEFGIPVMGHIGFTPQSHKQIGIKSKGKNEFERKKLLEDALALQESGVFSIVLEMVEEETTKEITQSLDIPTIGIGSGKYCDGQVLVWHDLLGLSNSFTPKFAKKYLNGYEIFKNAIVEYIKEVETETFPSSKHVFKRKE